MHMLTNDGDAEGLFRAAFMQSGSFIPVGGFENGQRYYDKIVSESGCSSSEDTLECLREVPYEALKKAIDKSPGVFAYQGINLAWLPRVDGVFLTQPPQYQMLEGRVANVPVVT
ncbi:hypothetical protein C0991_010778, partial [Blastosporella zonata]